MKHPIKQTKIFLSFLLALVILGGCTKEDPTPPKPTPEAITEIVLSTKDKASSITEGGKVTFIVKDNNGKDVKDAEIYVADKKIQGSEHTFTKAGTFKVYAKYKELKSSELTITVTAKSSGEDPAGSDDTSWVKSAKLSVVGGKTNITQGESLEFKLVEGSTGKPIKLGGSSVIIYVGKIELEYDATAKPYTFRVAGTYKIKAKVYTTVDQSGKHIMSNEIIVTVKPDDKARSYTAKAIVHRFTGTWCEYCPEQSLFVKWLKQTLNGKIIQVAIHSGGSKGKDPFTYPKVSKFSVKNYPTLFLENDKNLGDRMERMASEPSETGKAFIEELIGNKRTAGLAINYDLKNNKVSVKVGYDKAHPNSKLVVFIVEDGLIHDQVNGDNDNKSSRAYKKGNPIKNFEHNDVLRASLTDPLGDAIPDGEVKNNMYSKTFDISNKKTGIKDINKTKIVAFIIDSKGRAINAQEAKANQNQDFD